MSRVPASIPTTGLLVARDRHCEEVVRPEETLCTVQTWIIEADRTSYGDAVTATRLDVNPRLRRALVALLLSAVVACGGSVVEEPTAGTTGSTVPPTQPSTTTPVDPAVTTIPVDRAPEVSEAVEFPTLDELELLWWPAADLAQVAGITRYRFRSVLRGEAENGWFVVEGEVDETLPAKLLRIEDPEQGIFLMLSSGDRFWQARADQVFIQTEPPMEWPPFWPIPSYESAAIRAAEVLGAGPEVVGIEEIGEVSVLHLRSLLEGTEANLWVDPNGVLIRLEVTPGKGSKSGYYFELYDINGDIQIDLPG